MSRSNLITVLLLMTFIAAVAIAVATASASTAVTIEWSTASELNTAGFNLHRADSPDGPFTQINAELIPASPDPLIGGSYIFTDTAVVAGRTYYYQLEDVETSGAKSLQGTVQVTADGGLNPTLIIGGAAIVVLLIGALAIFRRKR